MRAGPPVLCPPHGWLGAVPRHPVAIRAVRVGGRPAGTRQGWPQPLGSVFCSDLSNNRISSLSNSSFTNMSQLTTL